MYLRVETETAKGSKAPTCNIYKRLKRRKWTDSEINKTNAEHCYCFKKTYHH